MSKDKKENKETNVSQETNVFNEPVKKGQKNTEENEYASSPNELKEPNTEIILNKYEEKIKDLQEKIDINEKKNSELLKEKNAELFNYMLKTSISNIVAKLKPLDDVKDIVEDYIIKKVLESNPSIKNGEIVFKNSKTIESIAKELSETKKSLFQNKVEQSGPISKSGASVFSIDNYKKSIFDEEPI